jgi:acetate kinase
LQRKLHAAGGAAVTVLIVPTDEKQMIARYTRATLDI